MEISTPENNAVLDVRIIPRAKHDEVVRLMADGRLKVRLKAPPVDGKANQSLIKFLAGKLGISKKQLSIISGQTARNKRLRVEGISQEELDRQIRNI